MGRQAGSWKAEMNSLRSNNISAISSKPQPVSKDPFVRNVLLGPSPSLPTVANGDSPSGLRRNHRLLPSSGAERHSVFLPKGLLRPFVGP